MIEFPSLDGVAILSPMAGVTDVAFRTLCKRYGAALTVTEFTSAAAITRASEKASKMLQTSDEESPVAVQLFGHDEDEVVAAAKEVQGQFDIIDINCGCPAWKVVKSGAGSAMLNDPSKIARFVERLVSATDVPITVKIRAGIDDSSINAIEVARAVESAGASAIAVHGRTQKQGYSGSSDWDLIRQVKSSVRIPVIGNGDLFTPEDVKMQMDKSSVDYVMVARGAIGNPYVFKQIKDYMERGEYTVLTNVEKMEIFLEYLELSRRFQIPFAQVKIHAQSFSKGLLASNEFRRSLANVGEEDLEGCVRDYIRKLGECEMNIATL